MRHDLITLLFVCAATPAVAQEPAMLPCGVPYECAVNIRVANAIATWRMTFDRRWPAVYDIVHWQIAYTDGRRVEYLAQLVRTEGRRMRYRFFVHERRGVWYTLGIKKRWVWRSVGVQSAEHNEMARRLRHLYNTAHTLRFDGNPLNMHF